MPGSSSKFLALLRGINVGGKNIIAKQDLIDCFQDLGFESVHTYIQSGNVLFRSTNKNTSAITKRIEQGLSERFSYAARAVVISSGQYASAIRAAPKTWGMDEDQKHNALFLLRGIQPKSVLAQLPPPVANLESVGTARGVIFWSASKIALGRTSMMKLAQRRIYAQMTVRNHNTVFRLKQLLDAL